MELKEQLNDSKYLFWVKGGLALKKLKDGFRPFVEDIAKSEHAELLKDVQIGSECDECTCTKEKLKPKRTPPGDRICPKGRTDCDCYGAGNRDKDKKCKKGICDRIYDDIVQKDWKHTPCWKNTQVSKWCTDPWEIAKCFIHSPGYDKGQTVAETDVNGLLLLLKGNDEYQTHVSFDMDFVDKVKGWRDFVFHSPNMELEYEKLKELIEDVITLLQDKKELKDKEYAKKAVETLERLRTGELHITMDDEAEVLRTSVKALEFDLKALSESVKKQGQRQDSQDQSVQDLYERVEDHEERICSLETEMSEVRSLLEGKKQRLETVERRIRLRKELANLYQTHYTKIPAGPLNLTDSNIDISDVYVCPSMTKEVKKPGLKRTKEHAERRQIMQEHKTEYGEIFKTDGDKLKRIYITGDIGSGKTVFCKMMLSDWCKSVMNADSEDKDISQYEFLFYISLRNVKEVDTVREMIHLSYKRKASIDVLDDLLDHHPEKCLVLLDGLDEWEPKPGQFQPDYSTFGLPDSTDLDYVTIMTTSRPSVPAILKMRVTEYGTVIKLNGIKSSSKEEMIEKYVKVIEERSIKNLAISIVHKLEKVKIQHLEQCPLMLQQIVWLICNEEDIGSSKTEIYCSLLNLALRWYEKKTAKEERRETENGLNLTLQKLLLSRPQAPGSQSFNVTLAKPLEKFPSFQNNAVLVYAISAFAFDILVKHQESKDVYGKYQLTERDIDKYNLTALKSIGLLTEERCDRQTMTDTRFSFIHISYLEFFAAVYLTGKLEMKDSNTEESQTSQKQSKLLENLKSFEDVLKLENVLTFACGLKPDITTELCSCVDRMAPDSDKFYQDLMNVYRPFAFDREGKTPTTSLSVYEDIQKLVLQLVNECKSNQELKVPLAVTLKHDCENPSLLDQVDPHHVLHTVCTWIKYPDLKYTLKCQQLQTVCFCNLTLRSEDLLSVAQFILSTKTLRTIIMRNLKTREIRTVKIDLSSHFDLHHLYLSEISCFEFKFVSESQNPVRSSSLKQLYLEMIPTQFTETADLVTYINTSPMLESLVLLSHGTTQTHISPVSECTLVCHSPLQEFIEFGFKELHVTAKEINTESLEVCETDCDKSVHLLKESRLKTLKLMQIKYTKDINDTVLTLPQLQRLILRSNEVEDGCLKMTREMKHLEYIELKRVKISLSTFQTFVDSLLTLDKQVTCSVTVDAEYKDTVKYIVDNPQKFQVNSPCQKSEDSSVKFSPRRS